MPFDPTSTIAAPATGPGGAISIIRVSGSETFAICDRIFKPADPARNVSGAAGYTVLYGDITEGDKIVDVGSNGICISLLLLIFSIYQITPKKPHTHTPYLKNYIRLTVSSIAYLCLSKENPFNLIYEYRLTKFDY